MSDIDGFNLPTDAFVEILLRLPTTTRRLLRFVCKRWRDVIDERVPDRHVTPKTLAFFRKTGSAIVFSDSGDQQDDEGRGGQQEWSFSSSDRGVVHLVGTCNGLLCLRNDVSVRHGGQRRMCSTITVVNPITGQRIMAPHSSISWDYRWCLVSRKLHRFSFGYHPTTGKYKVVDVTCSSSSSSSYKTGRLAIDWVQVFTFTMSKMESSWREVLDIPDWGFQDSGGVVTVDGATHWLAARGERVVALDLEDDGRVTSFEAPPDVHQLLQDPEEATCRLTNVHERLGVLVTCRHSPAMRVDLWVLEELEDEGGHRRARWSRKCSLMEPTSPDDERWITSPHFTHGEYVLSKREAGGGTWLYRHRMGDLTKNDDGGEKAQKWPLEGEEFMYRREVGVVTFPFVETTEPLPICKPWETRRLGIFLRFGNATLRTPDAR